ncbi:hypothetical protein IN07_16395 [Modestobacter caceresii]|uniref:Allene oxide cyclase barrel-like domain-containing protein n=1 Tax=Modestobacter caceresii TaxID=1522368 RepID=A0A098Y5G0_9ACTN|nr:hypothetical protein [Modestobacter caceresii]KGH45670.1 hypothetical protein IN07_16395 [Modestobacter caceresii]
MSRTVSRPAAIGAAGVVLVAGSLLTVVPAAAGDQPLRLSTEVVRNTDLDLGDPGPSAGDTQVFLDDVRRDGRSIGSSAGSCTLAEFTETRLVGHCAATLTLPKGTITVQGAFDENPSQGPTGYVWAVTGGTGRYADAGGEVRGTFRPDTDIVDLEIHVR